MSLRKIVYLVLGMLSLMAVYFLVMFMSGPVSFQKQLPPSSQAAGTGKPGSQALTILLLENEKVFYYYGNDMKNGRNAEFREVRSILINNNKEALTENNFRIVIKPTIDASYKTTVDALDLMAIYEIKDYAMEQPSDEELELIEKLNN